MATRKPNKATAKPAPKPTPKPEPKVLHGHPSVLNGGHLNEAGEWVGP